MQEHLNKLHLLIALSLSAIGEGAILDAEEYLIDAEQMIKEMLGGPDGISDKISLIRGHIKA